MTDLFDADIQNDHYSLLCELNKKSLISIKTPVGITNRKEFQEIIMQGGVWGPLKCSVQIDDIGNECMKTGKYLYKYKDSVDIPPLAMIDNIAAVSNCGIESVILNAKINSKIESKRLQLGPEKCQDMHIERQQDIVKSCPILKVHENEMLKSRKIKFYIWDLCTMVSSENIAPRNCHCIQFCKTEIN